MDGNAQVITPLLVETKIKEMLEMKNRFSDTQCDITATNKSVLKVFGLLKAGNITMLNYSLH